MLRPFYPFQLKMTILQNITYHSINLTNIIYPNELEYYLNKYNKMNDHHFDLKFYPKILSHFKNNLFLPQIEIKP